MAKPARHAAREPRSHLSQFRHSQPKKEQLEVAVDGGGTRKWPEHFDGEGGLRRGGPAGGG